jgi:signal transduction histidine kinase/CheY-like chemotaxis protein
MKHNVAPKTGTKVISGYLLIVLVMLAGLFILYRNLVAFSDSRLKNEEHRELLIVGNTLSRLYEIESEQNLFTAENATVYFRKYDSIVPQIAKGLDSLKMMSEESLRINKLDSIILLVDQKRVILEKAAMLLDSMRTSPEITTIMESSYVPPALNREITRYLTNRNMNPSLDQKSDTSVVKGERKGFMERVRNVFVASEDSTLVIEKQSVVTANQFKVMVDTLINKIRTSEKLDLKRYKQLELEFLQQLEVASVTNRMLTARIDGLLKSVEQEEREKSIRLVMDRQKAISSSQQTLLIASTLAVLIALLFGLLFLIDLNKSRRYRRELEQSHKRISDLLAAREKLMLTISHDIKAPMSSIMGYVELIEEEDDPVKRGRFLYNMKHSGEHVLRLVSTLLDYHRIESGRWQLKESRFDLHTLTEETVESFRPLAMQKDLMYTVENRIPEKSYRFGDLYVIRQIMGNLLSNAIKYTMHGEISVVMQEEIREQSDWFIFTVSDTGEGIKETDQQLIFREFKQLDTQGGKSEPIEGSGLGLAITKGFVDVLGGEIELISEVGKGSTFIIGLPLKNYIASQENLTAVSPTDLQVKQSVLVVDDDVVQLTMISEMLQRLGLDCITERDPEKVISHLKDHSFKIIFIDIQMPYTNGFTMLEKVKAALQDEEIPLIALTAQAEITDADFRDAGFSGFLGKPFTLNDLRETIFAYLPGIEDSLKTTEMHTSTNLTGVSTLIDFVKDDPVVSKAILQSFIDETSDNIEELKGYLDHNDDHAASKLSHKMLPLYRMMRNKMVVFLLQQLEKEKNLSRQDKDELLELLKESVVQASVMVGKLSGD